MSWVTKIRYEGDCWMWAGCTVDGYGNYRGHLAHRVVYAELRKKPVGRLINTCGHRACVNPDHWKAPTEEDRFWAKVDRNGPEYRELGSCWVWTAGLDGKGYGAFRDSRGRQVLAHRKAWELIVGVQPSGNLLHRCDTPTCIRPDHMFVGDQAANVADAVAKGRNARNEQHGSAKLTWKSVTAIRARYASGESQSKIASDFGVTQVTVSNIVQGKTWREG